jgi:drug/metabolite transporter (DMT)-like permease
MPTSAAAVRSGAPIWLGLLILYVVWGSTYLGIAVAVDTIPPFLMAGVRFLIAGVVLLVWSIARGGRDFRPPSLREWRDSSIVGALLLGGGMGMVAYGEQTVPSGITALIIALMPVWVAILGRVFLKERLPRMAIAGIVLGFVGVAILIGPSAFGGTGALEPLALAAILFSPISWSSGSLFASNRATLPSHPLVATGAQMVTGGLVLMVMSLASGELVGFRIGGVSTDSLIATAYLTVIGSLLAFTAYGWLLRVAPLPLIATYAYVNPIVAVILGAIVLSEPIEPRTLLAGAVIVVGVAVIVSARGRMAGPRSQAVAGDANAPKHDPVAVPAALPRPSTGPTTG